MWPVTIFVDRRRRIGQLKGGMSSANIERKSRETYRYNEL